MEKHKRHCSLGTRKARRNTENRLRPALYIVYSTPQSTRLTRCLAYIHSRPGAACHIAIGTGRAPISSFSYTAAVLPGHHSSPPTPPVTSRPCRRPRRASTHRRIELPTWYLVQCTTISGNMSVVYEPRNFIHDGGYPPMDEPHDTTPDSDHFPDPSDAVVNELAATVATFTQPHPEYVDTTEPRLELPSAPTPTAPTTSPKEESPTAFTPQRSKAVPKPDREITMNLDGKFICTWPGCAEEPREFVRKCEWNKHMDKHDRPYKCGAAGCEKLPGFTYSGGLLRHEREVHGKHGGPKHSFYCPHPNCKRHTGKGFSRQENLNEHLRRVHTQNGIPLNGAEAETDDGASDNAGGSSNGSGGSKRKRDDRGGGDGDDSDLREEIKRVRLENEELRRQVQAQTQQTVLMMQKITALQQSLEGHIPSAAMANAVPTAPMAAASMI